MQQGKETGKRMSEQVDIESLMRDLVKASSALKRKLYRHDKAASTTPEGTAGPTVETHVCLVCRHMAAGQGAQIRHRAGCELGLLQAVQKRLRAAWPELFETAPKQKAAA